MTINVGLIGARGYVGREMLELIARHPELSLAYASSREWDGKPIADMLDGDVHFDGQVFEALGPEAAADRQADVVILGLPNGKAAPFVEALSNTASESVLIDLSADYRHDSGWIYGLPERNRAQIKGATRIANPGCYATAAQLALLPLQGLLEGQAHVFGLSGWSGAGTTPSRKNDPEALHDNVIPYGLVGHGHEKEIAVHSGEDVRFMPCVTSFFRGLIVTVSAQLAGAADEEQIRNLFAETYQNEPFATLLDEPAEPVAVAGTHLCQIGRPQLRADGRGIVVTSALDNLLKGAASQAIQNLNLVLGFDEKTGLTPAR
ncbi:N-acetyl-gamma-glutamyl-phosphate reductase [Parvularcula marina]|uniref:N-acetyl-gamma-glutamyl-phosphate reductase n=1 Tax=Parvularcula marina TaxID=2292771 RepID=A0A371RF09_9PROT|nr:N-acetyl-gamma-glutamyl-phosphate reductase [Parvularcula marina]RFB04015.1 N-acetyl-gamma-glutamyl-phosphate reductase [Parvularcula marina]